MELEQRLRLDYVRQKLSVQIDNPNYGIFNVYLSGKIDALNELEKKRIIIKETKNETEEEEEK